MPAWTMPPLSVRYWTCPACWERRASRRWEGGAMVPTLALGMRPRGPRRRATGASDGIMSGVARARSNVRGTVPEAREATSSSPPAVTVPVGPPPPPPCSVAEAARAASLVKTTTRTDLPVPWGRETEPRRAWPGLRGSRLRFRASSMVSSWLRYGPSTVSPFLAAIRVPYLAHRSSRLALRSAMPSRTSSRASRMGSWATGRGWARVT
mmetsp:Transcript_22996/g.66382  ORF Transcript_22996/g.66382 Transcript_22996/m.66382 type:complete len:209 (+) Transcript_22996:328-954(+)